MVTQTPAWGLARFSLGGRLANAIALITEFASGKASTRVMAGYHVGAVATVLLGLVLLLLGWRSVFVVGAITASF